MPADSKRAATNRTIDEKRAVLQAKQFVMTSHPHNNEALLMRDLLCIIERLAHVPSLEYQSAIFNERTNRHGSEGYLRSVVTG